MDALGDDRADFGHLAQLLDVRRQERLDRGEALGQNRAHAPPTWRIDRALSSRPSPRVLLASICCQQVFGRLLAHPLQADQLVAREPVQVAVAADEPAPSRDQLIDQLVAESFDVHRVAAGEIAEPLASAGPGNSRLGQRM